MRFLPIFTADDVSNQHRLFHVHCKQIQQHTYLQLICSVPVILWLTDDNYCFIAPSCSVVYPVFPSSHSLGGSSESTSLFINTHPQLLLNLAVVVVWSSNNLIYKSRGVLAIARDEHAKKKLDHFCMTLELLYNRLLSVSERPKIDGKRWWRDPAKMFLTANMLFC